MSTRESIAIDAKFDREPRREPHKEECTCAICHEAGCHEGNELKRADDCYECEKGATELRVSVDFKFSIDQYHKAREWEKENRFNYKDNISHLLMDWALKERVNWEEI